MNPVNPKTVTKKILCPAKVNLCLDIIQKNSNGYHQIKTVFLLVTQKNDTLYLQETPQEDSLSINQQQIKTPTHPAFKALKILKQHYQITQNYKLSILQNLPPSSGLGTASSAAAALLLHLNKTLNLKASEADLLALGAQVGMDVPFFLTQTSVALGENHGEKITKLKDLPPYTLALTPKTSPLINKTQTNYSRLNLDLCGLQIDKTEAFLKALQTKDTLQIQTNLHNDFSQLYPSAKKDQHLSGSGPSTFKIHFDR